MIIRFIILRVIRFIIIRFIVIRFIIIRFIIRALRVLCVEFVSSRSSRKEHFS